jgi:MFS family permease
VRYDVEAGEPRAVYGRDRPQRSVLVLLAAATAIGSTGLAAGGTAGALLGAELAGTSGAAGMPLGLLVVGSAVGALVISRQASRGRRGRGLMLGYALGAVGAVVVVTATVTRSLSVLLVGSIMLGAANSSIFLTRYAAAETGMESNRGRVLGTVFAATAVGAVVSPMLLGPSGALARVVGLPRLSGLYLVAVVTFGVSALLFAAGSNPRVPWFGRSASVLTRTNADWAGGWATLVATLRGDVTRVALVALVTTNFIMVGMMAVAPVSLMVHGKGLELIGAVIALHVAGMFAWSPISGSLADRFGPTAVVLLGGSLLLATSVAGMLVHEHSTLAMASHLVVLGVGWNCGVVGGSTLLANAAPDTQRAQVEGIGEVAMGLAAAVAAPVAGVVVALFGYRAFSLVSVTIALCALLFVRQSRLRVESRSAA